MVNLNKPSYKVKSNKIRSNWKLSKKNKRHQKKYRDTSKSSNDFDEMKSIRKSISEEINPTSAEKNDVAVLTSRKNSNSTVKASENFKVEDTLMLFVKESKLFVTSNEDIFLYNRDGGNLLHVLRSHKSKIVGLCKDPCSDDETVISCDSKGNVICWNPKEDYLNPSSSFSLSAIKEDMTITHFIAALEYYLVTVVTSKTDADNDLKTTKLCLINKAKPSRLEYITTQVLMGQNKVVISSDWKYIAAIKYEKLFVLDVPTFLEKKPLIQNYRCYNCLTCVAFHPSKNILAAGNVNGQIILYYHIPHNVLKTTLHWHTMPVQNICFSASGNDLYSGSDECVLVRWQLSNDNRKYFLPRIGMPIRRVQTDPKDSYVAVLHIDSSLSIVNSKEMKLEGRLHRQTYHTPITSDHVLSVGLLFHQQTGALVKNGRTGYLQFFNPRLMKVIYDMDITLANFVTEEQNLKLPNVDVTKASLSEDGSWLVTCENCTLTSSLKETVIKFWFCSGETWSLNTAVQKPHKDVVNAVTIMNRSKNTALCLSCSEDGTFIPWEKQQQIVDAEVISYYWNSIAIKEFRNLPATACSFSPDGTVFAVAFENVVTLWETKNVSLKAVLSQPFLTERIMDITFSYSKLQRSALVTRSSNFICSWNLLSCSLLWRVYVNSTCLAVSQNTGLMALFSKNREVFFFEPSSNQILSTKENVSPTPVVCAIFLPSENDTSNYSEEKEELYYFDSQQTLYNLLPPHLSNQSESNIKIHDKEVQKTRGTLKASRKHDLHNSLFAKTRNVAPAEKENDTMGDISFASPSIVPLLKELDNVTVHNISFISFIDHVATFIPDLRHNDDIKAERTEIPKYKTIEEERVMEAKKIVNIQSYVDDSLALSALLNMDYKKIIQKLESS